MKIMFVSKKKQKDFFEAIDDLKHQKKILEIKLEVALDRVECDKLAAQDYLRLGKEFPSSFEIRWSMHIQEIGRLESDLATVNLLIKALEALV